MSIAAVHESAIGPKRTLLFALHISAFGGKADIRNGPFCSVSTIGASRPAYLSAIGVNLLQPRFRLSRISERDSPMKQVQSTTGDARGRALILLVILMLAGLPVAVWLDLRNLTETSLLRQAKDLNSV